MKATEVTVNVTANDIARGKVCDCTRCPVARALKRRFPQAVMAQVLETYALVRQTDRSRVMHAELPSEARAFIACFDYGVATTAVRPIKFKLSFAPARQRP